MKEEFVDGLMIIQTGPMLFTPGHSVVSLLYPNVEQKPKYASNKTNITVKYLSYVEVSNLCQNYSNKSSSELAFTYLETPAEGAS